MKNKKSLMLLLLLGLLLPTVAYADGDDDTRYLSGSVPEENGKVVFSKEFIISGMSKKEIYTRSLNYLTERMAKNQNSSRVAYTDEKEGVIATVAQEWLVFSQSFISLDRSEINYQVKVTCSDGKCIVSIARIFYLYQQKEKYTAEEWISDKVALNKTKTKLIRGMAKWRRKTVDMVDDYYKDFLNVLSRQEEKPKEPAGPVITTNNSGPVVVNTYKVQPQNVVVEAPVVAVQPKKIITTEPSKTGTAILHTVTPENISSSVLSSIYRCKTVVTIGNDQYNMTTMTANKGIALGYVADTPMAFLFFDASQAVSTMETAKSYTVKLIDPSSNQIVMIIECDANTFQNSNGMRIFVGTIQGMQAK